MKYTNKSNLPKGIYDALVDDDYTIGHADHSISQLNSPPQMRRLIQLNTDKIVVDISTEIWKLLGTSVHYILQKSQGKSNKDVDLETRINKTLITLADMKSAISRRADSITVNGVQQMLDDITDCIATLQSPVEVINAKDSLTEERMYLRLGGKVISGKPDRIELHPDSVKLEDYKVTSVWKILKSDYRDWEFQLNAYALIADSNGIAVDSLQVNAILKDWKKFEFEQQRNPNYPEHPVAVVPITRWNLIDTAKLLLDRISEHELVKGLTNPTDIYSLRPCTNEEKWHGEDKYAVMKEGGKRASATFDTDIEAWQYISERTDGVYKVEPRLGEDKRCEEFCLAKPYCMQYAKEHGNTLVSPTANEIDISILPADSEVEVIKIIAVDKTKALLNGILDESNASASENEVKSSPATTNEAEALLDSFHKEKKKPDFDLSTFLGDL